MKRLWRKYGEPLHQSPGYIEGLAALTDSRIETDIGNERLGWREPVHILYLTDETSGGTWSNTRDGLE